ncbi:MAG: PAS domain S-box protein [Thermodesulfobacteriota bacterium]
MVILSSYHQGYDWSDKELAGLLDRLQQVYPTMDPPIEYLDAKRLPGPKQQERLKHYLIGKYRGRQVDLVIVLDNPALNLALGARQELFAGVPLVFAGINNFKPDMLQGQEKVTGVAEVEDAAGTLKLALKLQPGAREVLVIHDYTATGLALRRELEPALSAIGKQVKVSFTPPATFQEILEQVQSLPAGAIGLITGFATDSRGVSLGLAESTRMLAAAPVPLYAMHETRLGHGIVGGVLLAGREHGRQAGEMALLVLAGEDPSRIPVLTKSTAKPMVDYHQLIRFAISLEDLPPGILVINQPRSFFQRHKRWIVAISMTVLFLSLVIFILSTNIVRRRLAEKALLASKTSLRSLIDCTGEAIITVDLNRIITTFNPASTRMLGYAAEEVLGKSAAIIHPSEEHFQRFGEAVYPVIAATGSWRGEYELRKKDGTLTPSEMSLTPLRLPDGTLTGYIGAHRDISEQKRAEEALRQSEERFRLLVENAPDAIIIQTAGRFAYVNKEALRLFGANAAEQLVGQTIISRVHPSCLETAHERMRRLNEAREAVPRTEQQYLKMDGAVFDAEVSAVPFRYQGENGALIFLRDVTERKLAEAALRKGLQLNQTLMDSLPCVAMLLKPHTREIVAANKAAVKEGAVPGALCYATFGRREDPCPFCQAPMTWGTGQAQHLEVEARGVVWDAHWVPIQEDLYLHYAFDITARKEAENSQKMLEAQLFQAQKMEALGTLAGGIAHDFNNVLGAMMGFTELACLELPESMAVRTYLDNVLKAGERARHLVKQILSFSRQEKVVQHPISLPPIIKETLKFLRASLPTTIKIRTRLQAGEAIVVADPTQIHQTLLNLCTNAAHAMEETGGTLEIGLRALIISPQEKSLGYGSFENLPPGSYLELLVSDTGHGMEPAVLERIFDPFFTTKEPWKGTGMGLAVVYGIVKSLNGEIQVTSQPGRGTTFRVLLPLAEGELPEAAPEVATPLARGAGRILFVDDDEDFFPAGQRMLAELGYEVVSYSSSLKALEDFATQPHRFDLIISDLTMPGLTGLELATACLYLRPEIPFILATGFSETVTPEKVRTAGIREVVAKPFNLRQIGEIIERLFKE